MKEFLSFVRSHILLSVVTVLLAAALVVVAVLLVHEFYDLDLPTGAEPQQTESVSETAVMTESVTETETQTEAMTEPPTPYFDAAADLAYHPTEHTGERFGAITLFSENHRVYAAYPDTDSAPFNDYCLTMVSSMILSAEIPETARDGGTTVAVLDYMLYLTEEVYSAVFSQKMTDTVSNTVTQSVTVLTYNIKTQTVHAPLDCYDMTEAADILARKIRAGYKRSMKAQGLTVDTAFLDVVCTPDPSSFVNIAVDADNMYFFTIYETSDTPWLLCADVPFASMRDYTREAIEARKQAEMQQTETEEIAPPIVIPTYDHSGAVPESDMVGNEYFEDAVFIGNSLIVGLQKSAPLKARYFASIGLNVSQVFTKQLIPMKSGKIFTISDALATVQFSKVYLMFGINELGWGSIAAFIDHYGRIIDRIREINPEAIIYVQSILPINEEKWAKSRDYQSCINNFAVAAFNQKIVEMCDRKNVAYVNVGEVLTDETGNLFTDATSDGIHIGGIYATRWIDYLKTHTITFD